MAKNPKDVVDEFHDRMRKKGTATLTVTWPDFYAVSDIDRFKEPRAKAIQEEAASRGLIVGYGKNVVTVCHDTHFAP